MSALKVGLIGYGAIGQALATRIRTLAGSTLAVLERPGSAAQSLLEPGDLSVHDVDTLLAFGPDVVVECAGHEALASYGEPLLRAGRLLIAASVGALADAELYDRLNAAALAGGGRLQIVPGAIAGLDALSAIPKDQIDTVVYQGTKAPAAWRGTAAEASIDLTEVSTASRFFQGTAREAARLYPKNANVVAATALAGIGFERTRAELWVDPQAEGNIHRFTVEGSFGSLSIDIRAKPLAGNAKSSALTPESLFRAVRNLATSPVI